MLRYITPRRTTLQRMAWPAICLCAGLHDVCPTLRIVAMLHTTLQCIVFPFSRCVARHDILFHDVVDWTWHSFLHLFATKHFQNMLPYTAWHRITVRCASPHIEKPDCWVLVGPRAATRGWTWWNVSSSCCLCSRVVGLDSKVLLHVSCFFADCFTEKVAHLILQNHHASTDLMHDSWPLLFAQECVGSQVLQVEQTSLLFPKPYHNLLSISNFAS